MENRKFRINPVLFWALFCLALIIAGNLLLRSPQAEAPVEETVPVTEAPTETPTEAATVPATEPTEETQPTEAEETWQGFDVGAHLDEISFNIAIQIGDTGFNQLGFSQLRSDLYIKTLSNFADRMAEKGVRVISAPAPTAVGVMIEEQYLPQLKCASQKDMQAYLHDGMSDNILKVDVFSNLLEHNGEYLFFRTDHHWTALGAYYAYEAICEALGYTPTPLEEFEVWDQGEFAGSLYGRVKHPTKLRNDNLVAYIPPQDLTLTVYSNNKSLGQEKPVIADFTSPACKGSRYSAFLSGESVLSVLENNEMEEGPSCIVVKDSFGNCLVPYLAAHYKTIYAVDYRIYRAMTLEKLAEKQEVDDVIFAPYLIATQATDGNDFFKMICR